MVLGYSASNNRNAACLNQSILVYEVPITYFHFLKSLWSVLSFLICTALNIKENMRGQSLKLTVEKQINFIVRYSFVLSFQTETYINKLYLQQKNKINICWIHLIVWNIWQA